MPKDNLEKPTPIANAKQPELKSTAAASVKKVEKKLKSALIAYDVKEYEKVLTEHKELLTTQMLSLALHDLIDDVISTTLSGANVEAADKIALLIVDSIVKQINSAKSQSQDDFRCFSLTCFIGSPQVTERLMKPDVPFIAQIIALIFAGPSSLVSGDISVKALMNLCSFEERRAKARNTLLANLLKKMKELTKDELYEAATHGLMHDDIALLKILKPHIKTIDLLCRLIIYVLALGKTNHLKMFMQWAHEKFDKPACERLLQELVYHADNPEMLEILLLDSLTDVNGNNLLSYQQIKSENNKSVIQQSNVSPLANALMFNKSQGVIDVLLKNKANLNWIYRAVPVVVEGYLWSFPIQSEDEVDWNTFPSIAMLAAGRGNLDLVKKCLQAGVSVDERNIYGETLLFIAVLSDQKGIVEYLLENNANIHFVSRRYGVNAQIFAHRQGYTEIANRLHVASLAKWLEQTVKKNNALVDKTIIFALAKKLKSKTKLYGDGYIEIIGDKPEQVYKLFSSDVVALFKALPAQYSLSMVLEFIEKLQASHRPTIELKQVVPLVDQKIILQQLKAQSVKLRDEAQLTIQATLLFLNSKSNLGDKKLLLQEKCARADRLLQRLSVLLQINPVDDVKVLQQLTREISMITEPLEMVVNDVEKKTKILEYSLTRKLTKSDELSDEIKHQLTARKISPRTSPTSFVALPPEKVVDSKVVVTKPMSPKKIQHSQKREVKFTKVVEKLAPIEKKEAKQIKILLEFPIEDDKPEVRALYRNALLWLCATLLAKTNNWHARNALFHHHDILLVPGNDLEKEYEQYEQIVNLAYALVSDTPSELLTKNISKNYVIPDPTQQECLVQLNYGLDELKLYARVDKDLFPEFVIKAAEGFIAARLSTYVMPFLSKEYFGNYAESADAKAIHALVKRARPFKRAGDDARHGRDFKLPLSRVQADKPSVNAAVITGLFKQPVFVKPDSVVGVTPGAANKNKVL